MPVSEAEMLAPVVPWLEAQGWTVYQEVVGPHGGVADIVATTRTERGSLLVWAVEGKTSLSLAVIEQAVGWTAHAHFVSVAVPAPKRGGRGGYGATLLAEKGVGLILCKPPDRYTPQAQAGHPFVVGYTSPGRLHRRVVLPTLHDRQRSDGNAKAGTTGGNVWTPFRHTLELIDRALVGSDPVPFKPLLDGIRHHYATSTSARSSLAGLIATGVVVGCRLVDLPGTRTLGIVRTGPQVTTAKDAAAQAAAEAERLAFLDSLHPSTPR